MVDIITYRKMAEGVFHETVFISKSLILTRSRNLQRLGKTRRDKHSVVETDFVALAEGGFLGVWEK
ncbi:MAG: hypothetical protein EA411_07600 [Saprospirales bacterium]|nr:MAG: hypothetical protein EA411_07600 [Saprospirales bacterium]